MKFSLVVTLGLSAACVVIGYLYYRKEKRRRKCKQPAPNTVPQVTSRGNCPDYIYDGILLYTDEDRSGVLSLIKCMRKYSTIPNLSLDGYDALPLGGRSRFDCMDYVLNHCLFIFVYVSSNFTEDKLLKFQAQMCLRDVIKKDEWRVIPVLADKNYERYCPSEMKLLHGLEVWHLLSAHNAIRDYFISKFDALINDGRERLQ